MANNLGLNQDLTHNKITSPIALHWTDVLDLPYVKRKFVNPLMIGLKPEMLTTGYTHEVTTKDNETYCVNFDKTFIVAKLDQLLKDLLISDVGVLSDLLTLYQSGFLNRMEDIKRQEFISKHPEFKGADTEEIDFLINGLNRIRNKTA